MATMITFAADNEFFRKRKRVHKACDNCKKRRKRCSHTFGESDNKGLGNASLQSTDPLPQHIAEPFEARSNSQSNVTSEDETECPGDAGKEATPTARPNLAKPPRFIGYLSPEAILRGPLRGQRAGQGPYQNQCGFWVRPPDEAEEAAQPGIRPGEDHSTPGSASSFAEKALQVYLHAVGIYMLPPRPHQDVLLDIYFSYIQPFLPILDEKSFRNRCFEQNEPTVLIQAMCIVASKHDKARSHLFLSEDQSLLKPCEFGQRLYTSVTAAIAAKLETDRVVLMQVLALLSLHCEGFDGAEQASMHLAQAIHHAHTFGLQFGKKRKQAQDESLERLFWCLWSLDKLNASINGRPLIMHDRDNGLENPNVAADHRRTPFGICLQLSELLDKVIVLYRPGVDTSVTGWEDGFPGLEEIIGDGAENLDGPTIAALELFYHAVAMASCNYRSIHDPVRSTPSYIRQSLSAVRVISILSSESPENLPPLPIILYALSLAMSVAYRQFRQSKLQVHKNRAKEDLKTCCVLLNRLRTAWWSAGAMADLGTAALAKADNASRAKSNKRTSAPPFTHQPGVNLSLGGNEVASGAENLLPLSGDQRHQAFQTSRDFAGLNVDQMPAIPGQHPISSTRAELSPLGSFDFTESPDWLNFDNAFENFDTLLGSSGADLSSELLKPFNYGDFDFLDPLA